jgi:hypothetical protein
LIALAHSIPTAHTGGPEHNPNERNVHRRRHNRIVVISKNGAFVDSPTRRRHGNSTLDTDLYLESHFASDGCGRSSDFRWFPFRLLVKAAEAGL